MYHSSSNYIFIKQPFNLDSQAMKCPCAPTLRESNLLVALRKKKEKHHQFVSLVTSQRPIEMDHLKILQDWNHGIMSLIMNHAKSQQVWQRCADLEDSHGRCPLEMCWLISQHRKKVDNEDEVGMGQKSTNLFGSIFLWAMYYHVLPSFGDEIWFDAPNPKTCGRYTPCWAMLLSQQSSTPCFGLCQMFMAFRSHGGGVMSNLSPMFHPFEGRGPKRIFVAWQVATQSHSSIAVGQNLDNFNDNWFRKKSQLHPAGTASWSIFSSVAQPSWRHLSPGFLELAGCAGLSQWIPVISLYF